MPLLIGGLTIFGTFLCLRIVDQLTGLSVFALDLVSALGLGLAIDYSRRASRAIARSWRVSEDRPIRDRPAPTPAPRSGGPSRPPGAPCSTARLTVAAALAALTVFLLRFLYSMGIAGTLTALMAGAVALIVLPAILVLLGPRIDALTPAWMQRFAPAGLASAGWRVGQGSRVQ